MLFDSDLAYDATIRFYRSGLTPAIISINIITAISLIAWFVFGEFIGINRPGEAKKFIFVWLGIYLTQVLIFYSLLLLLHFIPDADDYLKTSASAFMQLSLVIINFLIFFILSILLSSRVIKTALPMSILISLIYKIKRKSR